MTPDNEKINTEKNATPKKLNYALLFIPLMPEYTSHIHGMWKTVTRWTL
jgi:hypothetical protein